MKIMMKFLRYFAYLLIVSTVSYYVSKYITYDKKWISMVIGFVIMFSVTFSLLCLETFKFSKKKNKQV
ncbi:hypothetical protein AZF04_03085 [Alkalihalobacillus trypoxylicola]|uniref:Uncharacterized protein n=1 Tax=Alkalihalobacillus trypoxylicola TaxID=519424 RepID=A0A162E5G8_9BACI|nr:hypothetical protein AZF04_03085 [Alkalihalobacillus trypoxylicola]